MMRMVIVLVQAATPTNKKLSDHHFCSITDVKPRLGWQLGHVINRAGGVDLYWKISKKTKKSNNSNLRFLKTIKLDE